MTSAAAVAVPSDRAHIVERLHQARWALEHDDAATQAAAGIRSRLSDMTAAQGYQDLTGQIILRVVELVRAVHAGLGEATGQVTPLQLSNRGHGPSIAGLDEKPATQDDANDLLSSLGI